MVNIIPRMRKLRELLWIRVGPGALVFPGEVTKISMEFNKHINGGHRGARKFWRDMMPRIKYRNPGVPIEIIRHDNPTGPATLNIYTSSGVSTTPIALSTTTPAAAVPGTATPAHSVDIRMTHESEILAQLVSRTQAEELKPTEAEALELQEIADFKVRSEKDRADVKDKLMKNRKEEEMLKLARGEMVTGAA